VPKTDPELEVLPSKNLRLRNLTEAPFVWFPRRESPDLYDRLVRECFRGGLKSPRIVQEGLDEATILSLVATGMGTWNVTLAVS
jgi:hypothetical protein